jgi:soluble lytic murein transglycosylase-like protein
MTSSYQGLAGNISSGADPTPEFLPAQQQANQQLQRSIDRFNQSVNANDAARMENAKRAGDIARALGELSATAAKVLGGIQADRIKKFQSEGQALAALNITNQEELLAAQEKYEAEQRRTQDQLNAVADKAAKDDKPFHVLNGIKKLNAYHLDEIQKIQIADLATVVASEFPQYYEDQGGANMSRADQMALPGQFLTDNYDRFTGFNPGFITKYGLPILNKFRDEQREKIDFQWTQTTSAQTADRAINTLLVDGNIGNAVNSLATTVDSKGKVRGPAAAYKYLVETVLPKAIKANLVSVTDVQEMFAKSEMPGMNGKTYADLKKIDMNTLIETAEADINADFSRNQAARNNAFIEEENEWMQTTDPSTLTNDQIDARQNQFIADYGKRSTKLDQYKLHLSVDAVQLKEADKAAQRLIESNSLTSERLLKMPWQIQQRYAAVAAATDKVAGDNYKVQEDAIKDAVEKKASVTPLGTRDPSVGVVTSIYQAKFHENLRQQLEAGNPNALNDALSITLQEFNAWSAPGAGNFSSNGYNIFADAATAQNLQANARVEQERVNSIIRTYGVRSLDQVGLVNSTVLRNDAANFGQRGFKHHPQIQRISRILQVDPITATNKMIEAYNLANQAQGNPIPLISLSPAAEAIRDDLPPQAKAKFLRSQGQMTPNVSLQVMSQLPGDYRPEMVPSGYGDIVGKAAKQYDIPAAILAGLLEQESGYLPEVINGQRLSSAGAMGIAQFMPGTAEQMGVDPFKPESAIPGAAKYLRHLMDSYGFDLREAIYAYNAGPGTVQRYGVGATEENKNYYPGIIKKAAKYGYKAAFRDPSMMRPVFQ